MLILNVYAVSFVIVNFIYQLDLGLSNGGSLGDVSRLMSDVFNVCVESTEKMLHCFVYFEVFLWDRNLTANGIEDLIIETLFE